MSLQGPVCYRGLSFPHLLLVTQNETRFPFLLSLGKRSISCTESVGINRVLWSCHSIREWQTPPVALWAMSLQMIQPAWAGMIKKPRIMRTGPWKVKFSSHGYLKRWIVSIQHLEANKKTDIFQGGSMLNWQNREKTKKRLVLLAHVQEQDVKSPLYRVFVPLINGWAFLSTAPLAFSIRELSPVTKAMKNLGHSPIWVSPRLANPNIISMLERKWHGNQEERFSSETGTGVEDLAHRAFLHLWSRQLGSRTGWIRMLFCLEIQYGEGWR